MRNVIKSIVVIIVLAGGLLTAAPRDAECLGCIWSGQCYSSSICGSRCIYVKRDSLDVSGFCTVRY